MRYTKYNKIIHNFFYCLIALLIFISVPVSGVAKTFELNNYATNSMLPTASFYKDTVINDQFVIEANAGSNGTITPSGFVIVDQWNDQTFNFTPNTGYTVFDVLVNGVSVGRPASYTFISVTSNHTISVSFAIDTLTITASAGANGNIAPSGEVKVPYGSNQTFNITPNISYYISDVFVDSISVGSVPSYTFNNVTRNRTISSTFAQYNHNILATAGANGVITPSGLVYLNSGSNQSFNFTPNTGYHIFDVLVNGVSVGRPASYIFNNVSSNHTIAVSFAIDTLTITASAGANGNILPAGNVKVLYGSNQTFSFTPNTGYRIDSVFVNSVYVGAPSSYTFENIISNNTISAKFAILQYTITATAGLNGTITPSGIVQINHGASQNFRIRPNTGYQVDSIFVNGVYAGNDTSYTFTNVTSNQIIHGTFAPRTLTITIGTNPVGRRFIVDGNIYDSTQTFNWTAAETHTISTDSIQLGVIGTQYVWNSWTNGGTRTSNVAPLVNTTYTANFTTQHYLTMIANTGGSVTPPSGWFNRGQSVVITAIPDSKYEFSSWSGTGSGSYSGSGNPRTITIDGAINQTASFIRLPVQITIGTNFSGLTFRYNGVDYTTTQTRTVTPGTSQSISTTSPQPGATNTRYAWQNWSDGGAISHSIIPNSDSSFIANFLTQYYLTMSSTPNGTVFPVTGWQDSGRVLQIKATPNTGYAFRGWIGTGAGSYTGMLDSTNIQILNPITQSATFTLDTMIITASAGANGRITPSGSVKVPYGSSQTFTITPDSTYQISDVIVNGVSVGAKTSHTFTNVTSNQTIIASFTRTGYTITSSTGPNGTISPLGPIPVSFGDTLSFTITPNIGYRIDSVFVNGIYIGAPASYTFENIISNNTISAKFAILQYTITATAGLNGTITPSGIVQINHGASQNFRIRPNTGYQVDSIFVNGVYAGNDTSYTFTNVTSNQIIHGTFAPRTLTITIGTNPVGRRFIVDGNIYDSTQTFNWTAAEVHTISTDSIQAGVTGTQYVWSSWTNGTTRTSIVAPLVNTTYTANFTTQHYLTMNANTGGSVTPQSGWFNKGQSVVITAISDSKYEFSSWSGTGSGSYSGSINPRTITINEAINQTASFIRLPVQITIGTNIPKLTFIYDGQVYTTMQTRTVPVGTPRSISTTSPQPGATNTRYAWQNWSDGGAISHSIVPNSDSAFIANFLTQYYLTMSSTPNGTVSPVTGWQDSGRVLQIKATPSTGYAFRGWVGTGAGSYTGMLDSTNIQILNPITQSATFTLDTMIITASAGANGRITPSGSVKVPYGSSQTFTIIPDSTYKISDVVVNGVSVGAKTSHTFTNVTSNQTIIASFTRTGFTITSTAGANGTITPLGPIPVSFGDSLSFTITPNTGYRIDSVFVNGIYIGAPSNYTFVNITSNNTISAKFAILQYTITATAGLNGTITPSGIVQLNHGASQNFRIRPNTGYRVDSIFVNGLYAGNDTSYTITNVTANQTIHGTFAPQTLTITIGTNPVGRRFIVDGVMYNSTQTFNWTAAEAHTISTDSIQAGVTGTQYVWNSLTNGGAITSIVAPLVNTTYTANFTTQHYLTMSANPGGSVTPPSGWYNQGVIVAITAIPENNYRFTSWSGTGSGSYSGSNNPANITINNPITELANFTRNPIQITISTVPQGRSFIYNGQTFTATQTRSVDPGSQQSLGAPSPQPDISPDQQSIWSSWSDGGAQSHNIMPLTDSAFIAYFKTQYAITGTPSPTNAGTISPSGRRFYTEGDTIQLLATPNKGFVFTGWSGAITSTSNPLSLVVDGSKLLTANFAEAVQVTVTTTPVGRRITVDDFPYTSPIVLNWLRGSSHTITAISPQSDTAGIQYLWTSWSDTGAISHTVTPTRDTTFRAFFSTRYFLTMESATGGTVIPSNTWHTKGDTVTIVAFADSGYVFNSWTGLGNGSYSGNNNPAMVIMNYPITQQAIFSRLLPPPVLSGIPDNASGISTNPILSWFKYPGAGFYIVQVSTDSSFADTSKFVFNSVAITDSFIQVPNLANLKKYFWRINAQVGQDITKFSNVRSFTTMNANITVDSPIMNWATGFKYDIKWRSENLSGNVNIRLSIEAGKTYLLLKQNHGNTGLFTWRVPDTLIQNQITVLKCKLRIESSNNDIVFGESGEFSIVSGRLPNTVRMSTTVPFPTTPSNSTDYRLVSVPGLVDSLKFSNIVTGSQKFDWRIFADNGNNENFLMELSSNSSLKTGEGYWLIKKGILEITGFDISIPKLDSTAFYSISLHPGWNIIGNPFDKLITWQSILYSNNISFASQLHSYNGSYKQESTLEPFKGYYFFNLNNLTTLKIPYPFGWIGSNKTNEAEILWKVQIIYETEMNRDPENYVGIAPTAKVGEDSLDSRKPPLFMDQSFLYFERKDWDNTFSRFSSDLRPSLGDGQVWSFDISNPNKSQGTIHFNGITQIPDEYEVILINTTNTIAFNLREQSSYVFNAAQQSTPFKLIIGTAKFVEGEIANMIPDAFELAQNFPNPFNSSTTISVKLPIDSELMIEIFNMLGQKVKVLTQGRYPKGVHTFSWNGTDSNNQIVPTGIYFYRMTAGKEILLTKKMIIIK